MFGPLKEKTKEVHMRTRQAGSERSALFSSQTRKWARIVVMFRQTWGPDGAEAAFDGQDTERAHFRFLLCGRFAAEPLIHISVSLVHFWTKGWRVKPVCLQLNKIYTKQIIPGHDCITFDLRFLLKRRTMSPSVWKQNSQTQEAAFWN